MESREEIDMDLDVVDDREEPCVLASSESPGLVTSEVVERASKIQLLDAMERIENNIEKTEASLTEIRERISAAKTAEELKSRGGVSSLPDSVMETVSKTKSLTTGQFELVQRLLLENSAKVKRSHAELDGLGGSPNSSPRPIEGVCSEFLDFEKYPKRREAVARSLFAEKLGEQEMRHSLVREFVRRRRLYNWRKVKLFGSEETSDSEGERQRTKVSDPVTVGRKRGINSDLIRSDEDLEEVIQLLADMDKKDPHSRYLKSAMCPPMILSFERRCEFIDHNGYVPDSVASERERKNINPWVEQEKRIFVEKFLIHPKNFRKIATYLPYKSVFDCVQFYYLNKEKLELKRRLRERLSRKRVHRRITAEGIDRQRDLQLD